MKRIIVSLLLLLALAPAPAAAGRLPELLPARLPLTDYRTYTDFFETQQGYARLELFLSQELSNIKLAEMNARDGFLLTEWDRKQINEVLSEYDSTDPMADFFWMRQVDPQSFAVDPEGKLYILDDLAEIHSRWLVNFKKAASENTEARKLYDKLAAMGINNAPLSDYMNDRRSIYQAFYFRTGKIPQGFRLFPRRIDLITPYSDVFLLAARTRDFRQAGERIRQRDAFLKEKLGQAGGSPGNETFCAARGLLSRMEAFVNGQAQYIAFEKGFLLADQCYRSYVASGDRFYLQAACRYADQALAARPGSDLESRNMANRLLYVSGMGRMVENDPAGALERFTAFLDGASAYEKEAGARYEEQKQILTAANQERIRQQERSAAWGKVFGIVAAALGAYASSQAASQAAQGMISQGELTTIQNSCNNAFVISVQMMQGIEQGLHEERDKARFREEAAQYLSPLFLLANRYLDSFEMVQFFLALGKAQEAAGLPGKALESYEEAAKIVERQRGTIAAESQRISFFSARKELYERMVLLNARQNRPGKALEVAERAKSRAFVDLMAGAAPSFADSQKARSFEAQVREKAELDTLLAERTIAPDQVKLLLDRTVRGITLRSKEKAGPEEDRELSTLVSVNALTADEIARIPGPGTAILEYFLGRNEMVAFLVSDGTVSAQILPVPSGELETHARTFRQAIAEARDDREGAAYFYRTLVLPFAPRIAGKDLIIVPFGALHALPFQAFLNGERRLFEDAALSYAPSATVLSFALQKPAPRTGGALVVGDPTSDLPNARQEAGAVAAMLPGSRLLLEGQGTKKAVKENAGSSSVIHLAAHGVYDADAPLRSRILLAKGEDKDGALTAEEIFSLSLPGSLVVLSACESAVSEARGGDELIGLSRGFLFAGARSLVASLWPVSDEATYLTMTEFYKNLAAMPKNQALRQAQKTTMEKYPSPFYWAPFTLTGAWN
ncbi:MAG: CHAT domain-containing protein [Thermodesulfobacteriota bacterium]